MTNISIFGKGNMGSALGERFTQAGNQVAFVGRDNHNAELGDIVVLAVPFASVDEIVAQYGDKLAGKIVIDITNPVNFETMDGLAVPQGQSAAQILAQKLPNSTILKGFNTNFAASLASGKVAGTAPTVVLLAGDSEQAKSSVANALNGSGLQVKDAGSLKRAVELEAIGFLQITLAVREQIGWTGGFAIFN